ncbi:MAG: DUF5606 domain-containing protein [Flavobacteriales bacterium]
MNLTGIISISGKPGLYKVVSQSKNSLIVEGLTDKKRFPAFSADKVSALDDISMYTTEEDVPLAEIIRKIWDKEKGGRCVDAKEEANTHHKYFAEILPNYDRERVYNSDLKKLFSWYNLLQETGTLKNLIEEAEKAAAAEKEEAKPKKKAAKEEKVTEEKAEVKESKAKEPKAKKPAGEKKEVKKTAAPKAKAESKAKTTVRTASMKRGA